MAIFNPIVLLISNFILFKFVPSIGKHTMPIALNVAFFIFFAISTVFALKAQSATRGQVMPDDIKTAGNGKQI